METPAPRIAFVSGNLNLGGATTFLCNAAAELTRRGFDVLVVSAESDNPLAHDFEKLRIPIFLADDKRLAYEDRILACVRKLREFNPTLVAGCLAPPSFEVLRYVPAGVRRVGMVQSDDPCVYQTLGTFHESLDAVVGVSKTIVSRLQKMDAFAGKQIAYIPYGVQMPPQIAPMESVNKQPLRILYLGRLDESQKRVRLFPQIYRQLCENGIPFRWTLAGEGPERGYLEKNMTGGRTEQSVVFLGQVDYAKVPKLLEDQDVLLLTSTFEGLPLSLLEAMGHGLVPVVSDLESGIREVVDESNGLLVGVEDISGYARALIHLHNNRKELAEKRGKARSSVYPSYCVSAMADRWLNLASHAAEKKSCWPEKIKLLRPLNTADNWDFSALGRNIRRVGVTLGRLLRKT